AHALGRDETAGRHRPRAGHGAGGAADGRAVRGARCAHQTQDAGRAGGAVERRALHRDLRDPFDRGGAADRQSHPGALAPPRPGQGGAQRRSSRLRRHGNAGIRGAAPAHPRSSVCRPHRNRARHRRYGMTDHALELAPRRPERVITLDDLGAIGDAARPLSLPARILRPNAVRRLIVVAVLAVLWQLGAVYINSSLLVPTLGETLAALWDATVNGPLIARTVTSLQVLLVGYAIGLTLAGLFT